METYRDVINRQKKEIEDLQRNCKHENMTIEAQGKILELYAHCEDCGINQIIIIRSGTKVNDLIDEIRKQINDCNKISQYGVRKAA